MSTFPVHAVYGEPPHQLVEIAPDSVQCSPLMIGSTQMKNFAEGSVASFVVHAPPGTLERRYVLARALRALAVGGKLTALAGKDKGGSRVANELKAFGCATVDNPRAHHRIISTTRPAILTGIDEATEAGGQQLHRSHGLFTHPGMFSWDRLDPGSALLLEHLPTFSGSGADLGCGIGVLSAAVLKSEKVTAITLVDIDRRAIACAERNIPDARTKFFWANVCSSNLPVTDLDFVVMNPPFHASGIEDKNLGQIFITRAAAMLKKGGQLWLTANRHLPYESYLKQYFYERILVAENDLYKIYKATK